VDFEWSEADEAFREQLRTWLAREVGHLRTTSYQHTDRETLERWEQSLRDAQLNAVSWPVEFGGQGFDPVRSLIFNAEYESARAPRRLNFPALGLLGPTLMAVGSAEQRERLLPRILDCTDVWCQGFSEPGAGSDLTSLRTAGRVDGDLVVINGQKTWCSNGARANKMFALVRTEAGSRGSKGISFVLVDLTLPGVEVRPITQVNGKSGFSEVFLTDVQISRDDVVGELGEGWRVARTTLGIERGASRYAAEYFERSLHDAATLAAAKPGGITLSDRIELERFRADVECWRVATYAGVSADADQIADLNAVFKLNRSEIQQRVYEFAMRALGPAGELGPEGLPDGVGEDFHDRYWHARASSIYAGTNEIQRKIIADRVLGLPREVSR
jgi:alkylation response protein AidB-like acyl-CoA dehydrogenase